MADMQAGVGLLQVEQLRVQRQFDAARGDQADFSLLGLGLGRRQTLKWPVVGSSHFSAIVEQGVAGRGQLELTRMPDQQWSKAFFQTLDRLVDSGLRQVLAFGAAGEVAQFGEGGKTAKPP